MTENQTKAPPNEQGICVTCGICCDGTLFLHANLDPGERGSLPEKIEENSYSRDTKDYFRLPCLYFDGKCTIYSLKRANVCSGYRCQLLKDFAEERMTMDDALAIVTEAVAIRDQIMEQYRNFSGSRQGIYFKKVLCELGKIKESRGDEEPLEDEYNLLLARCNIFEVLLIRHFSPSVEFEKMIMR